VTRRADEVGPPAGLDEAKRHLRQHKSHTRARQLAKDVLTMAANGGMPDSFWLTDQRIARAAAELRMTSEQAREWAHEHKVVNS